MLCLCLGQGLHIKWHLSPSSCVATTDTGQKLGVYSFSGRRDGSPSNTMSPRLRPTSVPNGILTMQPFGHNRHGPKIGGVVPVFGQGELGPHLAQCGLDRGPPSWSIQPFGHNRHGPKIGELRSLTGEGRWVPI